MGRITFSSLAETMHLGSAHRSVALIWLLNLWAPLLLGEDRPQSVAAPPGLARSAHGGSFAPLFSMGGRHLIFLSTANNLTTNDDKGPYLDVFRQNLETHTVDLVSLSRDGVGGGNRDSVSPAITADGRYVVFASRASDLVDDDTNEALDIFVRDLDTGLTTCISRRHGGTGTALGDPPAENVALSGNPLISEDGQWVYFESYATNLVDLLDTNHACDIFARDMDLGTTHLVSAAAGGTRTGNGSSFLGDITPDGGRVVFTSRATDLMAGATNGEDQILVRERDSGIVWWASRQAASWYPGSARFEEPRIATNGLAVVFKGIPESSNTAFLVHHHLETEESLLVASNLPMHQSFSVRADVNRVAYGDGTNVWIWDRSSLGRMLVSVRTNGLDGGNAMSHSPVLSPDGSRVAFLSAASNLVAANTAGVGQIYARDLEVGRTELASIGETNAINQRDLTVFIPALHPRDWLVAFESPDPRLAIEDVNVAQDIFLRDVEGSTTRLISRRHPNIPPETGAAYTRLGTQCLSSNGAVLVFGGTDNVWGDADTNGFYDMFVSEPKLGIVRSVVNLSSPVDPVRSIVRGVVSGNGRFLMADEAYDGPRTMPSAGGFDYDVYRFDLATGQRVLISERLDGTPSGTSQGAVSSVEGTFIAFESRWLANEFVEGIGSPGFSTNVYLRSLVSTNRDVKVVSKAWNQMATGNADSFEPVFSPDSRWLLFSSLASDLTTNTGIVGIRKVLAWNLESQSTRLVSYLPGGVALDQHAGGAVWSGNSRFITFHTTNDFVVYRHDLTDAESEFVPNLVICSNCWQPGVNFTGQRIAFVARGAGGNPDQIYLDDMESSQRDLVSVNRSALGGGNANSRSPLVSADGRYVAFLSRADDLVENDRNGTEDVFVRDLRSTATLLVSRAWNGSGTGNGRSMDLGMSADGHTLVFRSFANDLVPGDFNQTADIFLLCLAGEDSDGDGLEDDWEVAYFEDLNRDGAGDFDEDGHSDASEHRAGTDPTNAGSVLRVVTLNRLGNQKVALLWAATPGKAYRVEYKSGLENPSWSSLPEEIRATHTTAGAVDLGAALDRRFYRVRLVD